MHIDTIEQRSTNFRQIALDDARRVAALACGISVEATGTRILLLTAEPRAVPGSSIKPPLGIESGPLHACRILRGSGLSVN
jgi:hypothetical protein